MANTSIMASAPRMAVVCLTAGAAAVFACAPTATAQDRPLLIAPGVGHDRFEQSFFLEDTLDIDPDSLKTLKRTIEDLKESYVSLETAYQRSATVISNTLYATDAAWRNIATARTRWRQRQWTVDANARLEWKGNDDRDTISAGYLFGQTTLAPRYALSERWSVLARGDWEGTAYDERSTWGLDYTRWRGRAGIRYSGELLEAIDVTAGLTSRRVPDSSRLAYEEAWITAEASYWEWGPALWTLAVSHRAREYDSDGAERDHSRTEVELSTRGQFGERWRAEAQIDWEYWNYPQDVESYFDFAAGEVELEARRAVGPWTVGAQARSRWEGAFGEEFEDDDFVDWAIGPVAGWQPSDQIWVEAGGRWGRRLYSDQSLVYDDYDFLELDLSVDASVGDHFTLSLTGTYETERHDDPTRDSDYTYGALAIRFPFRL